MYRISTQILSGMLPAVLAGFTAVAGADEDRMRNWQLSLLFSPGDHQLQVEDRGRVMIYDGLLDADVSRALDEQFERVEHMMFTNTIITDGSGEPARDPSEGSRDPARATRALHAGGGGLRARLPGPDRGRQGPARDL